MGLSDRMESFDREAANLMGTRLPSQVRGPDDGGEGQAKAQAYLDWIALRSILDRFVDGKAAEDEVESGVRQQLNPAERAQHCRNLADKMTALYEALRDLPMDLRPAVGTLEGACIEDVELRPDLYAPVFLEQQAWLKAVSEQIYSTVDGLGLGQGSRLVTAEKNLVHECVSFAKRNKRTMPEAVGLARLVYQVSLGEKASESWGISAAKGFWKSINV